MQLLQRRREAAFAFRGTEQVSCAKRARVAGGGLGGLREGVGSCEDCTSGLAEAPLPARSRKGTKAVRRGDNYCYASGRCRFALRSALPLRLHIHRACAEEDVVKLMGCVVGPPALLMQQTVYAPAQAAAWKQRQCGANAEQESSRPCRARSTCWSTSCASATGRGSSSQTRARHAARTLSSMA